VPAALGSAAADARVLWCLTTPQYCGVVFAKTTVLWCLTTQQYHQLAGNTGWKQLWHLCATSSQAPARRLTLDGVLGPALEVLDALGANQHQLDAEAHGGQLAVALLGLR
jgi:hypothetical protein